MSTNAERARLIAQVRERLEQFPEIAGWAKYHLAAMLEEIDEQRRQLHEARAKVSELAIKLNESRAENERLTMGWRETDRLRTLALEENARLRGAEPPRRDKHSWMTGWG